MTFLRRRLSRANAGLTMVEFSVTFGTIYNGASSDFGLGCPANSWGYGSAYGGTTNASPANFRGFALPNFGSTQYFISNGVDACDIGPISTSWSGNSSQTFTKLEWWDSGLTSLLGTLYTADADVGSGPSYLWSDIGFFFGASATAYKIRLYY